MEKSLLKSKTFWFNLATAVAALMALPEIQVLLGDNAMTYVMLIQSIINILLRYFGTTVPIKSVL